MPKKSGSSSVTERDTIMLEIERSRLHRERSMMVLNKGVFLYFFFLFIGVIGFVNGFMTSQLLNILVIMGLCVLIIGVAPYLVTMYKEERTLDTLIDELRKKGDSK